MADDMSIGFKFNDMWDMSDQDRKIVEISENLFSETTRDSGPETVGPSKDVGSVDEFHFVESFDGIF